MQHRMASYRAQRGKWWQEVDDDLAERLLAEIAARGPSTARDLDDGAPRDKKHWGWNWSEAKKALDFLYMAGELAVAGRNSQFEVIYDVPERVIPAEVLALPTPSPEEADLELVRRAAASHGVATLRCLADYYRMKTDAVKPAVDVLVEEGELLPVRIEGWNRPAYLHRDARRPRKVEARAFLSPFDPVVWLRERSEKLFDFHYRIEIYTPAHKRVHGYYVLPFLLARRDRRPGRPQGRPQGRPAGREVRLGRGRRPRGHCRRAVGGAAGLAAWLGLDASGSSRRAIWRRSSVAEHALDDVGAVVAPGRPRTAAPSRAAAARCGPSASSSSTAARIFSGEDRRPMVRPAPARSIALPMKGWSVIESIGMTSRGRSWASATIVVAWPPCPTTSETSGITSAWGSQGAARRRPAPAAGRRRPRGRWWRSLGRPAGPPRRGPAARSARGLWNANVLRLTSTVGCDGVAGTRVTTGPVCTTSPWPESRSGIVAAMVGSPPSRSARAFNPRSRSSSPNGPFAIRRQQVSKECSRAT